MSYCEGATTVTIEVRQKGTTIERLISKNPPVSWACEAIPDQFVDHNMVAPIAYNFPDEVLTFDPVSGQWEPDFINYPGVTLSCPTTTTRPIYDFPPASKEDQSAEVIKIAGKIVIGNFDLAGRYFDNRGVCRYKVSFGVKLTILDQSGAIYSKSFKQCPDVLISCDDKCPSGYCRIEINGYPGYCCLPTQDLVNQLKAARQRLSNG